MKQKPIYVDTGVKCVECGEPVKVRQKSTASQVSFDDGFRCEMCYCIGELRKKSMKVPEVDRHDFRFALDRLEQAWPHIIK